VSTTSRIIATSQTNAHYYNENSGRMQQELRRKFALGKVATKIKILLIEETRRM